MEFRRSSRANGDDRRFTYSERERVPTPPDDMYSEGEVDVPGLYEGS